MSVRLSARSTTDIVYSSNLVLGTKLCWKILQALEEKPVADWWSSAILKQIDRNSFLSRTILAGQPRLFSNHLKIFSELTSLDNVELQMQINFVQPYNPVNPIMTYCLWLQEHPWGIMGATQGLLLSSGPFVDKNWFCITSHTVKFLWKLTGAGNIVPSPWDCCSHTKIQTPIHSFYQKARLTLRILTIWHEISSWLELSNPEFGKIRQKAAMDT